MALAAAGRGGDGTAGQRIRDEILVIQQRSGAKVRRVGGAHGRALPRIACGAPAPAC